MSTSAKIGFARQQYGRDRVDIQIDLDDLPDILTEYGVDEAGYKRMPFSVRYKALRLQAEIIAKTVYYEHELANARADVVPGQQPKPTAAMRTLLKGEIPALMARREALLEPYMTDEARTKLAARRAEQAKEPASA